MKTKFKRCAMTLAALFAFVLSVGTFGKYGVLEAYAEEAAEADVAETDVQSTQMLYVNADTKIYESKNEQSEVLLELPALSMVIPVEEDGEWTKVTAQGVTGYVKASYLQVENPNPEAIEEIATLGEYDVAFINELERLKAEKRRSRMYGAIIILLIVAIFGVGIFMTLKKKRNEEKAGTKKDIIEKDCAEN